MKELDRSKDLSISRKLIENDQADLSQPKCCIKYDADMLKNLCKATRFDYDTHDCRFNL